MILNEDDYYTNKLKHSWIERLRKILSSEYVKYRKENCHEFKLGFTADGRKQIQECRLKAKIYSTEKGIEYLKSLTSKDQTDMKQIQGAINILMNRINDYNNISIF